MKRSNNVFLNRRIMSNIQPKIRPPEDKGQDDRHIVVAYRPIAELKLDPEIHVPARLSRLSKLPKVFRFSVLLRRC